MVDCQPEETLSTEAEPRWTMLLRGDDLLWHPAKDIIFILLYQMSPFYTLLQYYVLNYFTHWATFSLNVPHCNDIAKNAATVATGLFNSNRTRIYFTHVTFFECHPPFYSPCKNCVTLKKCRPFNWPIRSQETNIKYNKSTYLRWR